MSYRAAFLAAALVCPGCVPYADFELPPLPPIAAEAHVAWNAHPQPLLTRGSAGSWDSVDALNPSVVHDGRRYWNFYSGYDGRAWHTGAAVSRDGLSWEKLGRVLSPDPKTWEGDYIAANGSALYFKGEFLYWYQGNRVPRIGLARSPDGLHWKKNPEPVLPVGPYGSWDELGVADPYVIRIGEYFYMYFLGQDRARRQRLGLARSQDGIAWEKLRSNPVLELGGPGAWDEVGLGEPAVWQWSGAYWMLYTARDRSEVRRTGLARSFDGVRWERVPGSALEGNQAWNAKVVCDPTVSQAGSTVRVWFGGGNEARPDENLNGQIGYATLEIALREAR